MLKKMVLLVLLMVVFGGSLFANGDSLNSKKKNDRFKLVKIEAPYPLCEKVFPGVQFFIQFDYGSLPPDKSLVAKYNGKTYYHITDQYNQLFKQVQKKSKATLLERVELLIQLSRWWHGDIVEVTDLKLLSQKEKRKLRKLGIMDFGYNYQAKVKIVYKLKYRGISELTAYIKIKNNIIEFIDFFTKEGQGKGSLNLLSFNVRDNPQVGIVEGNYSRKKTPIRR